VAVKKSVEGTQEKRGHRRHWPRLKVGKKKQKKKKRGGKLEVMAKRKVGPRQPKFYPPCGGLSRSPQTSLTSNTNEGNQAVEMGGVGPWRQVWVRVVKKKIPPEHKAREKWGT